jgi:hypothetical protein
MKGKGNKKELDIKVNNGKFNLILPEWRDIFAHAHCCIGRPRTLNRLANKPKTTERKEETLPLFLAQFRFVLKTEGSEVIGGGGGGM